MKKAYLVLLILLLAIVGGQILIRSYARSNAVLTRPTRIAVILNGDPEDRSYVQTYADAIHAYQETHEADIVMFDNVAAEDFRGVAQGVIDEGYWILICTNYQYEPDILELAEEHPNVYFLNGSGTQYAPNYASFLARSYQSRYLSGIVAGKRTATGEIGYVIAYPTPETIRQVNAFTLGAKKVNPDVRVFIRFTYDWNADEPAKEAAIALLDEHNIDVMSLHTNSQAPLEEADARGIYTIGNNYDNRDLYPATYLTACVLAWEEFLTERIDECERGKFVGRHYWAGMKTGAASLAPLTGNVYFATGDEVEREKQRILSGEYDVFYGPVTDNYGMLRVGEGENLPDEELLYEMNWYVDGVVVE